MAYEFYRNGSVEDVKASLRFLTNTSPQSLQKEIEMEREHKNRSTVIKMLIAKKKKMEKLKQYQVKTIIKRIHFEDHGQDFLWWDIDQTGKVIDCGPFQAFAWVGVIVLRLDNLYPGSRLMFVRTDRSVYSLDYPIESVAILQDKEVPHD